MRWFLKYALIVPVVASIVAVCFACFAAELATQGRASAYMDASGNAWFRLAALAGMWSPFYAAYELYQLMHGKRPR